MDSPSVFILAKESELIQELINGLNLIGYECEIVASEEELVNKEPADLLLIEVNDNTFGPNLSDIVQRIKKERHIAIILLADKKVFRDLGNDNSCDDFILKPYNLAELSVRVKRLQSKKKRREESAEYLVAGDITIDLLKCEVRVSGKVVDLTFTEYELLKLLIRQKGHVLTREMLLNEIWGYDYFGGDRTVDVHITRLRNKIEDTNHTFIETVRNIGYRIKINDG